MKYIDKSFKDSYYYRRLQDNKKRNRFLKDRRRYFLVGVVLSFFLVLTIYFFSDVSNVFKVGVEGNFILSEEKIIELSGISNHDKYWLIFTPSVSAKVKKHPLIKNVHSYHRNGNMFSIDVEEKRAYAYYYQDGQTYLWIEGQEGMLIDNSTWQALQEVPLLVGFSPDHFSYLEKFFSELSLEMLKEISEIHHYPVSYDDYYMQVIMRDGNYVFLSPSALTYLNGYYSVASGLGSKENICLYFDEVTGTGYSSACPWQKKSE